jgi:hypothetical protein
MSLLEDLNDYRLETSFETNPYCIVHTSYKSDRARGICKVVIIEKWARQEPLLGEGSFGKVWLERKLDGDNDTRAVKELSKSHLARVKVDYKKELLALTKFSKPKVLNLYSCILNVGLTSFPVCRISSLRRISWLVRRSKFGVSCHGILSTRHTRHFYKGGYERKRCSHNGLATS